jgi:hypothetical protein
MNDIRPVKGFEGSYEVDPRGVVYSLNYRQTQKYAPLKAGRAKAGYMTVFIGGKSRSVHRIVAEAFIANPQHKPAVNHKNGIRHDNRIENLEWVTYSENCIHAARFLNAYKPKLSIEKVLEIRKLLPTVPNTRIAPLYGVSYQTIREIRKGTAWAWV